MDPRQNRTDAIDPRVRSFFGDTGLGIIDPAALIPNGYVPPEMNLDRLSKEAMWNVVQGQNPMDDGGAINEQGLATNIEKPLVWQITVMPHANGRHGFIMTGDLVFIFKSDMASTGAYTVCNLGSLNWALRAGYHQCDTRWNMFKAEGREANFIDKMSERQLFGNRAYDDWLFSFSDRLLHSDVLADPGVDTNDAEGRNDVRSVDFWEEDIENAKRTIKASMRGRNSVDDPNVINKMNDGVVKELKDQCLKDLEGFSKDAERLRRRETDSLAFWMNKKDLTDITGLSYLHAGSIRDHWNLFGAVISSPNDQGFLNQSRKRGGSGINITVAVAKKTNTLKNYWHNNLSIGDDLYLILKRVQNGEGNWAEFQYVPWSNGKKVPSPQDTRFIDYAGETAYGHVFLIGSITESLAGQMKAQDTRRLACGMSDTQTEKNAYEASCQLDLITVHMRTQMVLI
jgi:hypothetical protein